MIQKTEVEQVINQFIENTDYQLINLTINADNHIVVEIDNFDGVDVDFCAKLTRFIEQHFDRNIEDYDLEVGSYGITAPFKTLMQYRKNIGNDIEILTREGKKLFGQLVEVNDDNFSIDTELKVQVEGKKRKQTQIQTLTFAYSDIKYAKYDLKI